MRLIAFVTEGTQTSQILKHIFAACGSPLWQDCGAAQVSEGDEGEPDWGPAAQPDQNYEVDQRSNE